jgi:hypothetical protein
MGVDLTLLPVTMGHFDSDLGGLAHCMLPLNRRRELWEAVRAGVPRHPVAPGKVWGYLAHCEQDDGGGHGYGVMEEDPYGSPLEWSRADDLARCLGAFNVTDKGAPLNVAAQAYLAALPGETPVVLYWH